MEQIERLSVYAAAGAKWILPALALWILARCVRSMLRERYEPEVWAWLEASDGSRAALKHWECIVGSAKSCDVVIDRKSVQKTHAALLRSGSGQWRLHDLSGGHSAVGQQRDGGGGIALTDGAGLRFADQKMVFHDLNEEQLAAGERSRSMPGLNISQGVTLLLLTVFQLLLALEYAEVLDARLRLDAALGFAFIALMQWCYFLLMRAIDRRGYEIETLAFFLSTLGLAVCVSSTPGDILKQLLLMLAGMLLFGVLGWWLRDLKRIRAMRWPVVAAALGMLALNVAAGDTQYGAANWLSFGGISIQPSELVKVGYIYVGASTLDKLFRRHNLIYFILF